MSDIPDILEISGNAGEDLSKTIEFLLSLNLLKNSMVCPGITANGTCGKNMQLEENSTKADGYRWTCSWKCGTTRSVRSGSIFSKSRLSLQKCLMIFYFYAQDLQIFEVAKLLKMYNQPIVQLYDRIRQRVISCTRARTVMNRDIRVGTGRITRSGKNAQRLEYDEGILECDESKFGKQRKYNKGKQTQRYWIFGLAQRNTRKTMFKVVHKRDANTLIPLIEDVATQGSTIYSDEWRAYNTLKSDGYYHRTVCHKREFKSKDGVCTNLIEGKL